MSITSHNFCKTTATLLDEAGLCARPVADWSMRRWHISAEEFESLRVRVIQVTSKARVELICRWEGGDVVIAPSRHGPIQRASPNDLMELASGSRSAPMQMAAILVLDGEVDPVAARVTLAERVRAVPRLRQLLIRPALGCGRPVWVDDAGFEIDNHLRSRSCPAPGDEAALLDTAAAIAVEPLPQDRPLWLLTVVDGVVGDRCALVLVMHHVLADGIGGLAALARLVDDAPTAPDVPFPLPPPSRSALFRDATSAKLRALLALPSGARLVRDAAAELRVGHPTRAPRCSLNQPTGSQRRLAIARANVAALADAAKAYGGTINDVLLTAVAGALAEVLRQRGESAESFVISVPISARREATATQLGNQVGVMPVEVPAVGDPFERLAVVAQLTRVRRRAHGRGASAVLLGPAFRVLARVGAFRWFVDRQRLVTTFVTNVRGPQAPLSFLGETVTAMSALSIVTGNITVAFAALSYAGTFAITVIADPERCPDLGILRAALQDQLDRLGGSGPTLEVPLPASTA